MKKTKNFAILLNLSKSLYNQDLILIYNDWKIITTDITLGLFAHKSSLKSQRHLHFPVLISLYFTRISLLISHAVYFYLENQFFLF